MRLVCIDLGIDLAGVLLGNCSSRPHGHRELKRLAPWAYARFCSAVGLGRWIQPSDRASCLSLSGGGV